ncbi:MAG TPA: SURF1 family protein [Legionella sp.]|nr:SURF1 family protein [Legionella sp.]
MILLTLFAMALFVRLGYWQLERASDKQQMMAALNAFIKQVPTPWGSSDPLPAQYQTLRVKGHFLPAIFLLDNQHHQHQFGYDVISPLKIQGGVVVLVDRGWVPGDVTRQQFPEVETPCGVVSLVGSAYYPSTKQWILGQALEKKGTDLAVVEWVDADLISKFLHKSVYPFIIRLSKSANFGYVREWAVVAMPPERHYGYAFQWFAIALAIFILFIALNVKKKI